VVARRVASGGVTVRAALSAALLVVLSVLGTVLALEAWARLTTSDRERAQLPHVGLGREDEYRLAWLAEHEERGIEEHDLMGHDPLLGWRPRPSVRTRLVKPGSYDVPAATNSAGLRGSRDVPIEKVAGTVRIAAFGGSQTFGTGVRDEETYPAQLEARLPDLDVLNFGVPGYGTDQMVLALERDGVRYDPDVVVLGFAFYHMRRNVQAFRYFAKPRFVLEDGGALRLVGTPVPMPAEVLAGPRPAVHALADRSVLLRWLWQRVQASDGDEKVQADGPGWELTRALLERFIRSGRERGAAVVLANIDWAPDPALAPALASIAESVGASFVDVAPTLRRLAREERLRLRRDSHWNARAHGVIAAAVAAHLCERGLVASDTCQDANRG